MERQELESEIRARTATVAVVGLGAVGLPLAEACVAAGFRVLGFERDADKLARLARGETPLAHLPADLVARLVASGRFEATGDPERLAAARVALVCVPTPLTADRQPDLECVTRAADTLAAHLPRGALVALESTTYPGTTRGLFAERFRAHGREPGRDVWLAFSPEREDPGRALATRAIPKLVGGTCAASGDLAELFYGAIVERVVRTSSAEVAESAKLLENVYRAVNIALVNELKIALDAMGIDVWEVVDAAATKPFGFQRFEPGPGMGGHCIPIDPFYLSWIARRHGVETRFIELAGEVNRAMPAWVVDRTERALATQGKSLRDARVLCLGLAYKRDVDITAESPAWRVLELLVERGARPSYSDPCVPRAEGCAALGSATRSVDLSPGVLAGYDVVIVVTDHAALDRDLVAREARLVVDTRRALADRMRGDPRYFPA